jgi:3-hydroxyacyl-[acyl-carrier-protein] dehydratase
MSDKPAPVMDVTAIEAILPHRYPFLLVDRVIAIEPMKKLVGVKCVTVNENFFNGHFPGHPVMPGVLILEALAQAGGLLVKFSLAEDTSGKVTYLMAIDNARFRKPVVPGDRMELHVEIVKQKGPIWKTNGKAIVDGEVVAEADYMAMLVDRKKGE